MNKRLITSVLAGIVLLFGMGAGFVSAQNSDPKVGGVEKTGGISVTKSFGSYALPEDWVEVAQYSGNGKYFYTHTSEQIGRTMTNISVEMGTNPYARKDHEMFRYAILRQLLMQAGQGEVQGSGTFTKSNDPLYIFTILQKEPPVTTIQHYIVGDYKYILVHVTDFHNETPTNAQEAAQFIVDSFVWAEQ